MRPAYGAAADALYLRFIQSYAIHVARLDPDAFEVPDAADPVRALLEVYEAETDEPFPQDPARQLEDVLRSMARAWEGTSARLLRQAKGAPADAGLGLVVQAMALGLGAPESGSGVIQFVDGATGMPQVTGRYLSQSQGRDAVTAGEGVLYLARDPRGASLEETLPEVFADLRRYGAACRSRLREEMQIEFTLEAGRLRILDAVRVQRTSRAEVRIAVSLARDGIIPKEEAILRVAPRALSDLLHRQVDPRGAATSAPAGSRRAPGRRRGASSSLRAPRRRRTRARSPASSSGARRRPRTSGGCTPRSAS
jgi:pyruvate, orthophosphate dikinase